MTVSANAVRPSKPFHFHRNVHFHSARVDFSFNSGIRRTHPMSSKRAIQIEDRQDRWRFTCPRGHRSWEPTNHHFWCQQCARQPDVDGVFYELRDRKTGNLLDRSEVRLMTPHGPYDRDLDREVRHR